MGLLLWCFLLPLVQAGSDPHLNSTHPAAAGAQTQGQLSNSEHVVIITSCIHASSKPLSYNPTRSQFSPEQRLQQTLQSIDSVKNHIPGAQVILVEQCELSQEERAQFSEKANLLMELSGDPEMKKHTEGPFKGLAESYAMVQAVEKLAADNVQHKWLFKLSGRYYLDDSFNLGKMTDSETFHMKVWKTEYRSFHTNLYSLPQSLEPVLIEQLRKYQGLDWANVKGNDVAIEVEIMNGIGEDKMTVISSLGVSGLASVSGEERHDQTVVAAQVSLDTATHLEVAH